MQVHIRTVRCGLVFTAMTIIAEIDYRHKDYFQPGLANFLAAGGHTPEAAPPGSCLPHPPPLAPHGQMALPCSLHSVAGQCPHPGFRLPQHCRLSCSLEREGSGRPESPAAVVAEWWEEWWWWPGETTVGEGGKMNPLQAACNPQAISWAALL